MAELRTEGAQPGERGTRDEEHRDDRGGEHSHHQGGPEQRVRPFVVQEEHHHSLNRSQRLCPGQAGKGGVERLPPEVNLCCLQGNLIQKHGPMAS